MKKMFPLMLSFGLYAATIYADNSKTAFVQFVNRKVQVHRDGKSIILKRGDRLSMNEEISIEENGKLEIEYDGMTFTTRKSGIVDEIIKGSAEGFKDLKYTVVTGVRSLEERRKSNKRRSKDGGVFNEAVLFFSE